MRKRLITGLLLLIMVQGAFGAILTNTNQSVQFVRMLSRNASTDIDAVYFNPAGITLLADGFHFAIHSQTISQLKTVKNSLATLNQNTFEGETFVPVFPDFYAVYKKAKMALSFGFGPIAGGGSSDFKDGLPDIEANFSVIPMILSGLGVPTTKYSADIAFKGSSIYYGFQLGFAYAIHDMVSVSLGARYNLAQNTYNGSIENIMIDPTHPLLNPTGALVSATTFLATAGQAALAAATADQEVDAEQTGSGITPIIGVNFKPTDKMNIGLKYEMNTGLELKNATKSDLVTPYFPDGEKVQNDIPAFLAGGISYQVSDALLFSVGGNYYFDKNADWDGAEDFIDSNTWEFQVGAQYSVSENVHLSAGFQHAQVGVSDEYQSGLGYELGSDVIGAGARINLGEALALELGGLYTIYKPYKIENDSFSLPIPGLPPLPGTAHKITYDQSTWAIAVGLEYSIWK